MARQNRTRRVVHDDERGTAAPQRVIVARAHRGRAVRERLRMRERGNGEDQKGTERADTRRHRVDSSGAAAATTAWKAGRAESTNTETLRQPYRAIAESSSTPRMT